ncbi:MAG: hypothetical protein LC130_23040, partial [Bryobacterales bacterium]|nr:hypothetical protein [Bryobacterales bacterium]
MSSKSRATLEHIDLQGLSSPWFANANRCILLDADAFAIADREALPRARLSGRMTEFGAVGADCGAGCCAS